MSISTINLKTIKKCIFFCVTSILRRILWIRTVCHIAFNMRLREMNDQSERIWWVSSGSVQNGAFRAMCSAVAEHSVVSNQIVLMVLSVVYIQKKMQRICDEVWFCEILNQRKCVYVQRQCNIVKLNSEIKISSNGLCSAKIMCDNCRKMCKFQTLQK